MWGRLKPSDGSAGRPTRRRRKTCVCSNCIRRGSACSRRASGRTSGFDCGPERGRLRHILPVPAGSGGGRLTERTPAVQLRLRERVKVPHTCRLRYPSGPAQLGGLLTFVGSSNNGKVAPKAVTYVRSNCRISGSAGRRASRWLVDSRLALAWNIAHCVRSSQSDPSLATRQCWRRAPTPGRSATSRAGTRR